MTTAYWRRPKETAESFWPGGWFKTGDAGYLDDDGYVFIMDRIKDLLMSGGENIYPAEVENAIMAHPAVQETAVIGIPSERWGETPLAVVVAKAGMAVTEDELIAFTRDRLAHYKCPTACSSPTRCRATRPARYSSGSCVPPGGRARQEGRLTAPAGRNPAGATWLAVAGAR